MDPASTMGELGERIAHERIRFKRRGSEHTERSSVSSKTTVELMMHLLPQTQKLNQMRSGYTKQKQSGQFDHIKQVLIIAFEIYVSCGQITTDSPYP